MNNKKVLVVGVLAVIVTMMVGYALFSETITINGTATAKGDFAITTTCMAGVPDNLKDAVEDDLGKQILEEGYSNDTCTVTGNTVSMNVNFKYPGARRYFIIKVKNTGSIGAKPDTTNHDDGMDRTFEELCLFPDTDNEECTSYPLSNTDDSRIAYTMDGGDYPNPIAYEDIDGKIWSALNDADMTEADAAKIYDLETGALRPGASMYFYTYYGIDDRFTGNTLDLRYKVNYEIYFIQPTN